MVLNFFSDTVRRNSPIMCTHTLDMCEQNPKCFPFSNVSRVYLSLWVEIGRSYSWLADAGLILCVLLSCLRATGECLAPAPRPEMMVRAEWRGGGRPG